MFPRAESLEWVGQNVIEALPSTAKCRVYIVDILFEANLKIEDL